MRFILDDSDNRTFGLGSRHGRARGAIRRLSGKAPLITASSPATFEPPSLRAGAAVAPVILMRLIVEER